MKNIIEVNDSIEVIMSKMSEGNIGAVTALINIFKNSETIDPDSILGGFAPILDLDSMGIYGTNIYILWNDVCGRNDSTLLAILRARQLGFLDESVIIDAASREDRSGSKLIDINAIVDKVKAALPNFVHTPNS